MPCSPQPSSFHTPWREEYLQNMEIRKGQRRRERERGKERSHLACTIQAQYHTQNYLLQLMVNTANISSFKMYGLFVIPSRVCSAGINNG